MKNINRKILLTIIALLFFGSSGIAESGTLQLHIFELSYMKAAEAKELVTPLLTSEGRVSANQNRNVIIVKDTPETIAMIEKLLGELDVRPVMLRVNVSYVDEKGLKSAGLDINWSYRDSLWSVGNIISPNAKDGLSASVRLDAREIKKQKHAEQTLLMMSNTEGRISSGVSIPYRDWFYRYSNKRGHRMDRVHFKDVNTGFVVVPTVGVEGESIRVRITPELSYLNNGGRGMIEFRELSTIVNVVDGVPVVIGSGSDSEDSLVTRIIGGLSKSEESGQYYMVLTVSIVDE
jgi:type II secretory pathway component GspD/PulD (secretin)